MTAIQIAPIEGQTGLPHSSVVKFQDWNSLSSQSPTSMTSFLQNYAYAPLSTNQGPTPRYRNPRWLSVAAVISAACAVFVWAGRWLLCGSPPYSALVNYQDLNSPSLVSGQLPAAPAKRAIVSTLYSDSYAIGIAVLGHSVRRANVTGRLILLHLAGRVSEQALCIACAAGWEPVAVPFIPPPHDGKGIYHRFYDQYTKLNIWGLDQRGVDQAVYLDADTLVLRNFEELFDLPFNFAAVPDVYGDKRGFTVNFNAGVLVFRPSTSVLDTMKGKLEIAKYPLKQAEQSFLNLFFATAALRLPYAYNANLAIKKSSPAMWKGMKDEMRIVHYTLMKPFVDEWASNSKLFEEDELRHFIDEVTERHDGLFAEEIGWWREAYNRMMAEARGKIEACNRSARPKS